MNVEITEGSAFQLQWAHNHENNRETNNNSGRKTAGFTAGRSCTANIFPIRQIIENKLNNLETPLLLIELQKAFDTIPAQKLFEIFNVTSINNHCIYTRKCISRTIKKINDNQRYEIKIDNKLSAPFTANKGIRQRRCLSPTLFKYIYRAFCRTGNENVRSYVSLLQMTAIYTPYCSQTIK